MSIINNKNFCPICVKRGTCMWEDKLSKLEGTKNNYIGLDVTVNGCEAFLLDENVEIEDLTGDNEQEEPDDED